MTKKIKHILFLILFLIVSFGIIGQCMTIYNAYAFSAPEEVYLGGMPIGIIADSQGLIVTEIINIATKSGCYSPALRAGINKGDIIIAANNEPINKVSQLNNIIEKSDMPIFFTIIRNYKKFTLEIIPEYDLRQNAKKIGITVKDHIAGIGTVTFIKKNGDFGALGHQIADGFGNDTVYDKGNVYICNISGYKKPTNNDPGELIGKLHLEQEELGNFRQNLFCGIFGHMNNVNYYKDRIQISLGSKDDVKPGKAYIATTINDAPPQLYQVEIIKKSNQTKPQEKGMVIRITDKELLSTTHGILQGMSGSPIIQDNKLIGAVTHVFTNDSTMGYGIYIDWMQNIA